jgi:hypothetical protein
MTRRKIYAALALACTGCAAGNDAPGLAKLPAGPPRPATLYVIDPCAPIEVLTGTLKVTPAGWLEDTSWFKDAGIQFYLDGRKAGIVKHCDYIEVSTMTGTHNVRVPLPGKSDYGINSDAGLTIEITNSAFYFATDEYKTVRETTETIARGYMSEVRGLRKK